MKRLRLRFSIYLALFTYVNVPTVLCWLFNWWAPIGIPYGGFRSGWESFCFQTQQFAMAYVSFGMFSIWPLIPTLILLAPILVNMHQQQCLPEFPESMERVFSALRILVVIITLGSFYTMRCCIWFWA